MRIQANGYVGIGLSYASYKLDISGDVNITGTYRINGVAITAGGGGLITGSGTANYITKWSGTSAITNSLIYDNGTKIGIGIITPTGKLHIKGGNNDSLYVDNDGSQYTPIYVSNNGTVKGFLVWDNTNAIFQLGAASANPLAFYTNSTERMRILSNGRIGINNSNPSYALQVTGTSGTGARLIQIDGTGTAYNIMSIINDGCQLFVSTEGNTGGNIATGSLAYAGVIDTNTNTSLQFATWATVRMTILNNGNVGIGTTLPSKTLSVYSSSTVDTAQVKIGSASTTPNLYLGSFGGSAYINYGGNYSSGWSTDGTNGVAGIVMEAFNGGSTISFATVASNNSPLERMRITSAGDVAIGTTSSGGYKLAVNGHFNAIGNVTSTGGGAGLFTQSRDTSAVMGWYSETTTYLYYYHGTYGATARITGSSGIYLALSDKNKKKNFEESKIGLNEIKLLKPTLYNMKTDKDSDRKILGFIAQDVKDIIPQAYYEESDFIGLSEMPIVATLVNAVKELSAKIELLEAK